MEISFRPALFTSKGLTEEEALTIVLQHLKALNAQYKDQTFAGIVLYVSTTLDNPEIAMRVAQYAIKYRRECEFLFARIIFSPS